MSLKYLGSSSIRLGKDEVLMNETSTASHCFCRIPSHIEWWQKLTRQQLLLFEIFCSNIITCCCFDGVLAVSKEIIIWVSLFKTARPVSVFKVSGKGARLGGKRFWWYARRSAHWVDGCKGQWSGAGWEMANGHYCMSSMVSREHLRQIYSHLEKRGPYLLFVYKCSQVQGRKLFSSGRLHWNGLACFTSWLKLDTSISCISIGYETWESFQGK